MVDGSVPKVQRHHAMAVLGINHIAFRTPDVEPLHAFYRELTAAEPLDGAHHPLRVGSIVLVFFESERGGAAADDPDEIAFGVDAAGFSEVLERATRMGVLQRGPVEHTRWSRGFVFATPTAGGSSSCTTIRGFTGRNRHNPATTPKRGFRPTRGLGRLAVLDVEAGSGAVRVRRRRAKPAGAQLLWRWSVLAAALVAAVGITIGLAYAGSPARLADGVRVAGVDVGGLTIGEATALLRRRAYELRNEPVVFTSGSRSWAVPPSRLGIRVDWEAAVEGARRQGEGFGPLRGLRRLRVRVFGTDVAPPTEVWDNALRRQIAIFARAIDRPHREAAVKLRGLRVTIVPGRDGRVLDRKAAARVVVRSLASLSRAPVGLPIRLDPQTVTAADLRPAAREARIALSAPIRMSLGPTRWRIPRWRIAGLLLLPAEGRTDLAVGGPGAEAFFTRLARRVNRPARNADFAITSEGVRVVPARDGVVLDVPSARRALLGAALAPTGRVARLTVVAKVPARSTAEARAMGITGLVGGYETIYGGEPNRLHNVRLVARLIDRTLIPPGATFSFNRTTGERTAEKGFREAPVIINGELQTGLGGGVCQVSTTVFNAAYEAGLKITARTNHALYIDHYPLARDATVNYPDIDLQFVNDTPRWLLLRTFVGSSSLTVNLYGTPVHRRVESQTAPLTVTGATPVQQVSDPALYVGERVTEKIGAPPRSTSVRRLVYSVNGKLLHDDTWSSYYRAEPTVIRVGTKSRPEPKPAPTVTKPDERPPPATVQTQTRESDERPSKPADEATPVAP